MNAAPPHGDLVLSVRNVVKRFGGLTAVDRVSLDVRRGEVVGIIGPNGAGKTALINLISGFYVADAGSVRLGGVELTGKPLHVIGRLGVARTFQNLRLFRRMSVLENVLAALPVARRNPLVGLLSAGRRREVAAGMALLDRFGLAGQADKLAGSLAYGDARRLEMARALATGPKLLLLDEPAAGMNEAETEALARDVEGLRRDVEAIVVIEHDMAFVGTLATRVVAMEAGRPIAEGSIREVLADPAVVEAYLGAAA